MNQLETNLALWAICSILLFEILCIICLCRCFFNRIKPKKFYVKREEYEYLHGGGGNNDTQSKFQSTILRPPHADELALVGTIRMQNPVVNYGGGIQNLAFYRDDEHEITPPVQPSTSYNWIELQPSIINTAQLSPAEYEIHSYPTDDYLSPRPPMSDYRQYRDDYVDPDDLTDFRLHSLHRPETIPPPVQRIDTSTESYGANYSTTMPKSILKGSIGTTPPLDLISTPYTHMQRTYPSSRYNESPRSSVKTTTDQSIPIESSLSKSRMRFASVTQLNEVEWEVPNEFQNIVYKLPDPNQSFHLNPDNNSLNRQRTQSAIVNQRSHVSRIFIPWERERNISQPDDITQQQAFEY